MSAARARRWPRRLLVAGLLVTAVAAVVALTRARVVPYTPGVEAAESDEITRTLERSAPAEAPRLLFQDVAAEAGVRFQHFHGARSTQLPEDMGSGVAWGDYDDDGDVDLYLVNVSGPLAASAEEVAASPARSALYRNDGGRFTDVTDEAGAAVRGTGMGAAWGDTDGDGDLDLVVTRYGRSVLLQNDGGRFADVSAPSGVGGPEGFWTGASFADFDRDGDLDLYVCGYVRYRKDGVADRASTQFGAVVPYTLNPSSYEPERNLLFVNDGKGTFREAAVAAGVDNPTGRSLSAAWADFDGDRRPDLYVANDVSDNAMFWNAGDGTFRDVSHASWVADYRGAMGLAIGDADNDGDLDIHVTHWIAQESAYYVNQKGHLAAGADDPMHFTDEADLVGLGQISLDVIGWGTEFLDLDQDGRLDVYAVNGSTFQRDDDPSRLVAMGSQLFWNGGRERGFFEVGAATAFAAPGVGRGSASADYDGDGDLDIAVNGQSAPARLLRNDTPNPGHWLRVVLRGPGTAGAKTTAHATGAWVVLTAGGATQVREVGAGPSYLSQPPPGEVHFGLGAATRVERLEISWPSGATQVLEDIAADAILRVREGESRPPGPGGAP